MKKLEELEAKRKKLQEEFKIELDKFLLKHDAEINKVVDKFLLIHGLKYFFQACPQYNFYNCYKCRMNRPRGKTEDIDKYLKRPKCPTREDVLSAARMKVRLLLQGDNAKTIEKYLTEMLSRPASESKNDRQRELFVKNPKSLLYDMFRETFPVGHMREKYDDKAMARYLYNRTRKFKKRVREGQFEKDPLEQQYLSAISSILMGKAHMKLKTNTLKYLFVLPKHSQVCGWLFQELERYPWGEKAIQMDFEDKTPMKKEYAQGLKKYEMATAEKETSSQLEDEALRDEIEHIPDKPQDAFYKIKDVIISRLNRTPRQEEADMLGYSRPGVDKLIKRWITT